MTAFASVFAGFLAVSVVGAPVRAYELWSCHVRCDLDSSQVEIQMAVYPRDAK